MARLLPILLLLTGWLAPDVAAQAWTMGKGQYYGKLAYGAVTASHQYQFDGRTSEFVNGLDANTFKDRSLYYYSELGLLDNLTLVLAVPYKRTTIRQKAFEFKTRAFGSATVGVRFGLLPLLKIQSSASVVAVNMAVNVPTGYTRNYAPSAGPGQLDFQASLNYGVSFYPLPFYAQAGLGFRARTGAYVFSDAIKNCNEGVDLKCTADRKPNLGDEVYYNAEIGASLFKGRLFLQGLLGGVHSLEEPKDGFTVTNPIPLHQRYLKVGGGAAVYPFAATSMQALAPIGFSIQYFITPDGRNTIKSEDLFVGVDYRIKLF